MKQFKILDKKQLTSLLFLETGFDEWILKEACFKTFQTITMDGNVCKDYYSSDEEVPQQITWGSCRQLAYQIIKGKHLPAYFKVVLCAPYSVKESLLQAFSLRDSDIGGLFCNIIFQDNELNVTTGAALSVFPPNKAIIEAWDVYIRDALKGSSINYDEL